MEIECCANCKYCHELWYWDSESYPRNKQYGHCCTVFHDHGEDTVMQLYGLYGSGDFCEMYEPKQNVTKNI